MKQSVWGLLALAICLQLTAARFPPRQPEFPRVIRSLVQASGKYNARTATWRKIPDTNLAHVYPYNAMENVVKDALVKWPNPAKIPNPDNFDHEAPARLLAFLDWLFLIDPQAVVNKGFQDAGRQISHKDYLKRGGLEFENRVLKNAAKRKINIDPAQLWRFNGRTLLNRQETYLHINGNSRLGIGKTKEGTPVTLERTGSKVSEIMAHHSSSWKRSRPITAQGNTNQWFTLYNVASKRYLTATGPRTMAIKAIVQVDIAVDSPWWRDMLQHCTSAPANLRYGDEYTNGLIGNWLDPMGDVAGNPTNKECGGARRPTTRPVFESFSQHSNNPAIMFSSTGSITIKEPAYRKWPTYDFYAIRVTTSVARTCDARYGEWGNYLATV